MVAGRTMHGVILTAAGLAMICTAMAEMESWPVPQRWNDGPHPIAALVWANANCGAELKLRPGTPRLQAEDLFEMASALDAADQRNGRPQICSTVTALAAAVALNADLPGHDGTANVAAIKPAPFN